MKPELKLFSWNHLKSLELREFDKMGFAAVPDSRKELECYLETGIVFSGIAGSKTLMIGGVCAPRHKVGFAWVLTSELIKEYPIFFHKACKEIIDMGIKEFNLHRLETTIMEGHKISKNWAERIGFEQECLMRKFDADGNNYYLYARVI